MTLCMAWDVANYEGDDSRDERRRLVQIGPALLQKGPSQTSPFGSFPRGAKRIRLFDPEWRQFGRPRDDWAKTAWSYNLQKTVTN